MKGLFDLAGWVYGGALRFIAPWHAKARQIVEGRRQIASCLTNRLVSDRPTLWIHSASLGEFEQGRPVLEELRRQLPRYQIVVSFFSPSGYNIRRDYSAADAVVYLPQDSRPAVREFLDLVRPTMAIFVKYDLWPTMLTELAERGVKTYLISAIFCPDQLFFRPWGGWYLRLLGCFSHIFVQDEDSRALLSRHGIEHASVAGDTRFDRVASIRLTLDEALAPKLKSWSSTASKIIVAGSTWPADEALLVQYLNTHSEVRMIIAPHETDAAHIEALVEGLAVPSKRLSQILAGDELEEADRCLVIDTIGHLSKLYRYGHVAYIGGGFGRGIHNTLEAVAYGIPVIMGPKMKTFREARDLVRLGGGFVIDGQENLTSCLNMLLDDQVLRGEAGSIALDYVQKEAGATERIVSHLMKEIEPHA